MSALLSQAIVVSSGGWQLMIKESASLERALGFCLKQQDPELKSVVQSLLYTTVRHRAQVELLLRKLVQKEPQENIKAVLSIALALLLENKEKNCRHYSGSDRSPYSFRIGFRIHGMRRTHYRP